VTKLLYTLLAERRPLP